MSVYKHQYQLEMNAADPTRQIDADSFGVSENWIIFYRQPPTGGSQVEYWRVRLDAVISMETKRG